jgi:tight adherence protein B
MTENGELRPLSVAKLRDVLEVVIVIDTSGSMEGEPLEAARVAAIDFVGQLDGETRVVMVGFGATASTKAAFGASRSEINGAISNLSAGGETALYDGLVLAADQFADSSARRFVVVLSDGKDTVSSASLASTASVLQDGEVNLYAIALASADADFSGLQTLAADVEGQVVAATDAASLNSTHASAASRLTNQYQVTYRSGASSEAAIIISVDADEILAIVRHTQDYSAVSNGVAPGSDTTDPVGSAAVGDPAGAITTNPQVSVTPNDGSLLTSSNALYLGAGGLFIGVLVALFVAFSAEPRGPSAFERLNFKPSGSSPRSGLANMADRATGFADRLLEKQEKRGALDSILERAGMDMRPGEYILTASAAALGFGAFGFIMLSPRHGLVFLVVGAFGAKFYVNRRARKRQALFAKQLGDTLMMMIAGSLRSGHGVVEAIDTVAAQAESPTSDEFTRSVAESRIGRDMVESLYGIAERTNSEDFIWVVRAISINRELGGDLAEILDNVGATIRDRNRLRDQVKALSAQGKISAIILFVLPIGVAGYVQLTNKEYMASMTDQTVGKFVFGGACFALIAGGFWLKKLVKVEF